MLKLLIILSSLISVAYAGVDFKDLKTGATIKGDSTIHFLVDGMKIKPAGELVEGTGHHHLIINGNALKKGEVVPTNETHIHFGKGQTSHKLDLKPGNYTLTLQFADGAHRSYGPKWSKSIKVTVK